MQLASPMTDTDNFGRLFFRRHNVSWHEVATRSWVGYEKQRPPGAITLKNGLDKFNAIYYGWLLAKDVGTQ
ncbi:MAG: hypothetical protein QM642_03375 [Edaphocola sp.]